MASAWIKVDHSTIDKPEIVEISGTLKGVVESLEVAP